MIARRTLRHLGRLPLGMLGACALALLIESSLVRRDLDLCRPENLQWRRCRAVASLEAPKAEILVFGTSMVQNGVLPRVIEAHTGRSAQGLAMYASQVPGSYYLLRHALEAGARPSAIVIDLPPNFLGSDMDSNAGAWSDLLDVHDGVNLAWMRRDPVFLAGLLTRKGLPSYAYRGAIRDALRAALDGKEFSYRSENRVYLRNLAQNKGAIVPGKRPEYQGAISEYYRSILLGEGCRPASIKMQYMRRFVNLAASRGIPVFWVMSPYVPELQVGRDARNLDAAYDRFARAMLSVCPNLVVLDARHSGYEVGVFHDALHLDFEGANVLSAEVANAIKGPSPSRWVSLPRFQPRPLEAPVEIVLDSYKAIQNVRR
jgi:hypothetical protein